MFATRLTNMVTSTVTSTGITDPATTSSRSYRYYKRDDDDSSSSTSSSKDAKCTGTKAQCQKPVDHDMSVTIGVAVAVPVVVVIVFLGVILYFVYRRGKKEALEDNDPDFDGDEYLPGHYPAHSQYDNHMETKQVFHEQYNQTQFQPQSINPFNDNNTANYSINNNNYNDNNNNNNNIQPWEVNPFHIPGSGSDIHSLRTFAKEIKMDGDRGYNLASMSRHASQSSLDLLSSATNNTSPLEKEERIYSTQPLPHEEDGNEEQERSVSLSEPQLQPEPIPLQVARFDDDGEPISPAEEENIRRMRSIYKVYLDRNDTIIRQSPEKSVTMEQDPVMTTMNDPHIDVQQQHLAVIQQQQQVPQEDEDPANNMNGFKDNSTNSRATQYRVASSIYSELPNKPADVQYQQQPLPQYPQYIPQQQYPQQQMQYSQQEMQYMPQQSYILQQRNHPQTLESIGELPPPARLAYSTSSHSLTSFRQPSKQTFALQTARLNGTALNPMDHPEMFYSQSDEPYMSQPQQQQYANDSQSIATNNTTGTTSYIHPYQLRNSIVMTNPSELQSSSRSYRPAGSFRKFNDPMTNNNSRNNSLVTSNNAYQQYVQSRVSGILEESDVLQPPSIPGILPHSGSSEDLRKQLGSSHNFNVSM
ncbi:similar to Saccharomyces cerevisiae YHR149C SKG6 Integral membrane protein that localizes primarily to growing sites such as the bud tip or the cell periphery [Maudiozyma barnettii]|uniref:Similar to Saccharomyces cerevisiae YHR149C SKG6 Integral membrane protein that localizes primarily to growing sites such as the bud tip or the cell periphery n=1 Tax=Maudiozyma barnettii TaxID=61262 RepID=A0A8H2VGA0_9SACH|nr:Skg6p [Kazachstania barnettii]CAB4254890.1 similar to Saccharomyces cerevisiae YHR149C SKG6 Integral membrane protein that localizes primarily to growing sites such as the bud tip or the cell periphery [Kazachstania barnettii]CAD1783141.1 similar to Saccharomyces cerevisiae YHR149C SKG6 Integral membrane protein that localizes primarily to growing sites such as the bud tip or the cell periphery [Kazachstania barnettii]